MMRLVLASLHRSDYRRRLAAEGTALDHAPDAVDVRCPTCGALYVADLAADEEPFDLEALEWAALVRLDEECPDHPHAFVVD